MVPRSARYYVMGGDAPGGCREAWVVVHGYGQLAARFLRHFAPLDDGSRLIVAPEALSRFYLEHPARAGAVNTRVGATWMTREDREAEIGDHVRYLDTLCDQLLAALPGPRPRVTVLGFSQGVATVARWLTHGHTRADRLILWSGRIPPELLPPDRTPLPADHPLRQVELDIVTGEQDELATPEALEEQRAFVEAAQLAPRWHRHPDGHRIHQPTLLALAEAPGVSARASGR